MDSHLRRLSFFPSGPGHVLRMFVKALGLKRRRRADPSHWPCGHVTVAMDHFDKTIGSQVEGGETCMVDFGRGE